MPNKGLKGQSAIEYLMTYGWMLLVVAIVGAAIFAVAQSESPNTVSGFTGANVIVEDFGVTTNDELELVLRNAGGQSTTVNSINVTDGDQYTAWTGSLSLGVGDSDTVTLANVSQSDGAETLDIDVNYDRGALTDLQISGTISGGLELTEETSLIDDSGGENGDGNGEQTQFYTDFSGDHDGGNYQVGDSITDYDWTRERTADDNAYFTIESDSNYNGGQYLEVRAQHVAEDIISWDDRSGEDMEAVALVQSTSRPTNTNLGVRGVADPSWEGYTIRYFEDYSEIRLYNSGSIRIENASKNIDTSNGYWLRIRAEGTSIKGKIWEKAEEEPQNWDLETTHDGRDTGFTGLYARNDVDTAHFDIFGVGINGAPAPTSPID